MPKMQHFAMITLPYSRTCTEGKKKFGILCLPSLIQNPSHWNLQDENIDFTFMFP